VAGDPLEVVEPLLPWTRGRKLVWRLAAEHWLWRCGPLALLTPGAGWAPNAGRRALRGRAQGLKTRMQVLVNAAPGENSWLRPLRRRSAIAVTATCAVDALTGAWRCASAETQGRASGSALAGRGGNLRTTDPSRNGRTYKSPRAA